jgi:uncharacterized protein YrzB (UPF0473 family)
MDKKINEENLYDEKLNIDDINFFDGQDEVFEVVSMYDENGNPEKFFIMDAIDVDDIRYLLVVKTEDYDKDEPDAYIYKEISSDDAEHCVFVLVEDDAEYQKVALLLQNEDAGYEMKY